MRLDVYIAIHSLAQSREKASTLIKNGSVTVNGNVVVKPSFDVTETDEITVNNTLKYVGRGGYKLEKALSCFAITLQDRVCLDIGASTGGFTDCMLQNGAKKVYAVDVGTDQLDCKLRTDCRVVSMEKTDIRSLEPFEVDFIGADLSFISLQYVFPYARKFLKEKGCALFLIKPQFEVGKIHIKNGVIKDKKIWQDVLLRVISFAEQSDFTVKGLSVSPIKGGDGNVEFLLNVTPGFTHCCTVDIKQFIKSL